MVNEVDAAVWIYAGGPHRTAFSQAATAEPIEDFAEMAGVECLFIDQHTRLREFKQQLRCDAVTKGSDVQNSELAELPRCHEKVL